MARIDFTAVMAAAGGGLAVIIPGAALSGLLADRSGGWVVWLFLAIIVTGFIVTGLVAGRLRSETPMLHGALGAAAAFVVSMVVGLVVAALRGRSISLVAVPVAALVAVTAGVCGGLLADRSRRRSGRVEASVG